MEPKIVTQNKRILVLNNTRNNLAYMGELERRTGFTFDPVATRNCALDRLSNTVYQGLLGLSLKIAFRPGYEKDYSYGLEVAKKAKEIDLPSLFLIDSTDTVTIRSFLEVGLSRRYVVLNKPCPIDSCEMFAKYVFG